MPGICIFKFFFQGGGGGGQACIDYALYFSIKLFLVFLFIYLFLTVKVQL